LFSKGNNVNVEAPKTATPDERRKPAVGAQVHRWRTERGLTLAGVAKHPNVALIQTLPPWIDVEGARASSDEPGPIRTGNHR
jgi:hypothetical protein